MCANVRRASVRVELQGDLLVMFEEIKKDRCLRQGTEAVRQLINEEYRRIQRRTGDEAVYGRHR